MVYRFLGVFYWFECVCFGFSSCFLRFSMDSFVFSIGFLRGSLLAF